MKTKLSHHLFLKASTCAIFIYGTISSLIVIATYLGYISSYDKVDFISSKHKRNFMEYNNFKRTKLLNRDLILSSSSSSVTKLEDVESYTNFYRDLILSSSSSSFKSSLYERYGINEFRYLNKKNNQRIEYDVLNFNISNAWIEKNNNNNNVIRKNISSSSTISELESLLKLNEKAVMDSKSNVINLVCMVEIKYKKFQHYAQYLCEYSLFSLLCLY